MKKITTVLAGSTAAMLLAAAPLLASAHEAVISANAQAQAEAHSNNGLHLGILASIFGKGHDNDGDSDNNDDNRPATTTQPHAPRTHAEVGIISSIEGSTFTLIPLGHKHATTTVSTASTTVFHADGEATSSSALKVGSRVAIVGTTTASSTITASMVNIFTHGFGWLKHFFHH
jgi:hypothetical protein